LPRPPVLIAAPDAGLRAALVRLARRAGRGCELADTPRRARDIARTRKPDAAIVAPAGFGAEGKGLVRALAASVGRLRLVAGCAAEAETLARLLPGHDVALAEPLDEAAVVAWLTAAERAGPAEEVGLLRFGGAVLDKGGRVLHDAEGREVPLSRAEFAALIAFVERPGRVLSREELRRRIFGEALEAYDRSVDMLVSRLRRKIEEDPRAPRLVVTVPGAGYKFAAAVETVAAPAAAAASPPGRGEAAVQAAPERRFLAILSCRLAGFPAIADALDPEEVGEVAATIRRNCVAVVEGFGGTLARFAGDAFTAYFGYPDAQEDETERAVLAGLALVERLGQTEPGLPAGLRPSIGIAAGAAAVGELAAGDSAPAAVGEASRQAARLGAAAPGDWVVVAADVRRRVGGSFAFVPLAPLVDATGPPIEAWRVVRSLADRGRFAARTGGGRTPFAGRAEELAMLRGRWRRAGAGAGQVVLLTGEPGIGKSRLVFELERTIAAEEHLRIACFGSPYHSDSLLYPVLRHLERAAGFLGSDGPPEKLARLAALLGQGEAAAAAVLPLLAELLALPGADEARFAGLSPQRRREFVLDALHDLLARLAVRQPVLMVWEDLQWLDSVSRDLLAGTVERAARLPVLVVATARPGFAAPWPDYPHIRQLPLGRLDRDEARALVRNAGGDSPLSETRIAGIADRADGVPLYLEELAKEELARARSYAPTSVGVPDTLEGLLLSRVDRLGPEGRRVAQLGAAIGRRFSYRLLRAADPDAVPDEALARLVGSGLVFRRGEPPAATYEFKHALVRDAAYGMLSGRRRRQLHGRIAAALEAQFADIVDNQPELLARHWAEAGDAEKAIDYVLAAAERALLRAAEAEARAQTDTAFRLLAALPAGRSRDRRELVAQLLLHRVGVATKGRTDPVVVVALRRARELCEAQGDEVQLPAVMFGQWYAAWSAAAYAEARVHALALSGWAEARQSAVAATFAEYGLGMCRLMFGAPREARRHFEAARRLDRFEGLPGAPMAGYWAEGTVRVASLLALETCLILLGRFAAARAVAREAERAGQGMSHTYGRAIMLLLTCRIGALRRDPQGVLETASALLDLADRQGYPDFSAHAAAYRGWALAMTGGAGEGTGVVRAGLGRSLALGYRVWRPQLLMLLAECHCREADAAAASQALAEAAAAMAANGERVLEAELHRLRGEVCLALLRDPSAAEHAFAEAVIVARGQGARLLELRAATSLARLCQDQGRTAEARAALMPVAACFPRDAADPEIGAARALLAGIARDRSLRPDDVPVCAVGKRCRGH
jgi:DNA-binding response OmpR family regulator/class 3 adenylate cyclase